MKVETGEEELRWRTCFGRRHEPLVKQTTKWTNSEIYHRVLGAYPSLFPIDMHSKGLW